MSLDSDPKINVPSGINALLEIGSFKLESPQELLGMVETTKYSSPHVLVVSNKETASVFPKYPLFTKQHNVRFDKLSEAIEESIDGLLGFGKQLKVKTKFSFSLFAHSRARQIEEDSKEIFEKGIDAFVLPITVEPAITKDSIQVGALVDYYQFGGDDINHILNLTNSKGEQKGHYAFKMGGVTILSNFAKLYIVALNLDPQKYPGEK